MDQHPLLEMHLRGLKLPTMLGNYRRLAGEVAQPIEYLTQLAALGEQTSRELMRARIAAAHFHDHQDHRIVSISPSQPQLPKAKFMQEYCDCAFVEQHRNVICIGPPGTGKTHCLLALGLAACTRGFRVSSSPP